jgi:hypothetical protein
MRFFSIASHLSSDLYLAGEICASMYNKCYTSGCSNCSSIDGMISGSYSSQYSPSKELLLQPKETYFTVSPVFDSAGFRPGHYDDSSSFIGNTHSGYSNIRYKDNSMRSTATYINQADVFLNPARPLARFVQTESEVQDLVNEIFISLTGRKLDNAVIKVCKGNESELIKQGFRPGVLGLAINNEMLPGIILVRNDFLDRMIVTIGHEIGHILSPSLNDIRSEEAKAFAFELAWVRKIKELNFGNLGSNLVLPAPAVNGVHDVALHFVMTKISEGKEPFDIHSELVTGSLKFNHDLDSILSS